MNNALSTDDVADLDSIIKGTTDAHGNRRNLRTSELEDGGVRMCGFGFATVINGHVLPTEAGHVELEARGLL